jgi:hypothetical protein
MKHGHDFIVQFLPFIGPRGGRVFLRWPEVAYYPEFFEHRLP